VDDVTAKDGVREPEHTTMEPRRLEHTTLRPQDPRHEVTGVQRYGRIVPICPKCGSRGEGFSTKRLTDGSRFRWYRCPKGHSNFKVPRLGK